MTTPDADADPNPMAPTGGSTRWGPVDQMLQSIWAEASRRDEGEVATYIPELAKADPSTFGLALATLDGRVYSAGPPETFTIQSVSKPFVYALALADQGVDHVLARIGTEPTGNAFNTISVDDAGRPFNPMVNAGAIMATSLVAGATPDQQFERIFSGLSAFAGRPLSVDEDVFRSEQTTGNRNRSIAYLLASVDALEDVEDVLSTYFRQCAIEVTAADLAVMSVTLANAGVNPLTGVEVVSAEVVSRVLAVMSTCGMYDFAGEWMFRVGLPAKSGVSGGIAAVHAGRLGIGAHSPLLDARGNSVRGIAACELLSSRLGLHLFVGGAVRGPTDGTRHLTAVDARSKRVRVAAHRRVLDSSGERIRIHRVVGSQDIATAERVVRAVIDHEPLGDWHIFDLSRLGQIEPAAATLIAGLASYLTEEGSTVVVVHPRARVAHRAVSEITALAALVESDPDTALQFCEHALLVSEGVDLGPRDALVPLAEQDLLEGIDPEALAILEKAAETRVYPAGTFVFTEGAAADGLYFIAAGQVSATIASHGVKRRLNTMGPGTSFGELALIDGGARSVTVVADEPTLCHVLTVDALGDLIAAEPSAGLALYRALGRSLAGLVRQTTREISSLDGDR
ncbi:MAG TPA: glutaminase A [Mycobacteriales bacterium]|nr:glutaminase A [Mycobacteriales bacterium]